MPTANEVADAMLTYDDPVVTAKDLADALDCSTEHVRQKMDALLLSDVAESKKAGARARVYWHVERVCAPHIAPEDHPDQSDLEDAARPAERDVDRETTEVTDADASDDLADDLDALDLAGTGDLLAERREAVRECYEFLQSEGTATRAEFIRTVYEDRPAGYSSEGGWWNTVGKDGLRGLAERRDDVAAPTEGAHQWRYVGE